jgi:biotin synthase-like enzyme
LKETRRSVESILAEFLIAKKFGWEIGFLTGGIGVIPPDEMEELLKKITEVYEKKVWISIGALPKPLLLRFKDLIHGVVGSTETINPELHKIICPSKPLKPYEVMFKNAKELGMKTAMTFIVGMGETKGDMKYLKDFIRIYDINKIHIYGLKPRKGTILGNNHLPSKEEQAWWIAELRVSFPKLEIQCGVWEDRLDRTSYLLKSGANSVSNFRATKLFGTQLAYDLENQVKLSGRKFNSNLTKLPDIDWNNEVNKLSLEQEMKNKIKEKLNMYLEKINSNQIRYIDSN